MEFSKDTYEHHAFQVAARGHVLLGHGLRVGVIVGVSEPVGVELDCWHPRNGFGVWFPKLSFVSARVDYSRASGQTTALGIRQGVCRSFLAEMAKGQRLWH